MSGDGARAAERRVDARRYDVVVCHGNVIRYMALRALQLPPEAWLRLCTFNCSITRASRADTFCGLESRRRRGWDVDLPRGRVARPETRRFGTWILRRGRNGSGRADIPRRRVAERGGSVETGARLRYFVIRPSGSVSMRTLGDVGHLDPPLVTFSMHHGIEW